MGYIKLITFVSISGILLSPADAQYNPTLGQKYFVIGLATNGAKQACLNNKGYPNYMYQNTIVNDAQLWGKIRLSLSVSVPDQEIVVWVTGSSSISSNWANAGNALIKGPAYPVGQQRLIPWSLGGGYTMGDSLLEGFTAVWGYWEKDLVSYYGYGCPRCGDQDYAAQFDATVPTRVRVTYNNDPVPNMAPNSCDRTKMPVLGANPSCWFQNSPAVLYSAATTVSKQCSIDDDPSCCPAGGNVLSPGYGDHLKYFGYTSAQDYIQMSC
ncbi:unnamed protein product, partial [Mesorhabditis spiculigera]